MSITIEVIKQHINKYIESVQVILHKITKQKYRIRVKHSHNVEMYQLEQKRFFFWTEAIEIGYAYLTYSLTSDKQGALRNLKRLEDTSIREYSNFIYPEPRSEPKS